MKTDRQPTIRAITLATCFQPVGPGDAPALSELFAQLDPRSFHPHPLTPGEAVRIAEYGGPDVFGMLFADRIAVAYGILRGWEEGFTVPSLGVAVGTPFLRRGYGRATVEALHHLARERGADRVRLRVNAENKPAVALYRSLGYRAIGQERGETVMVVDLRPTP